MTSLERAQAIIRSHIKAPEPLEFRKVSDYAIRCKCCGRFLICKVGQKGQETFEVWFRADDHSVPQQLRQNLPSGTDAKNWASAIASAYKKGHINLTAPPSREEIQRQREELDRLRATA